MTRHEAISQHNTDDDIRVERGAEVTKGGRVNVGVFGWRVPSLGLSGFSREPLLDACHAIKSLLGPTVGASRRAAMFREGHSEWDKRCSVEWGAAHYVQEDDRGIRFARRRSDEEVAALAAQFRKAS
jgi:hypothetical protein